MTALQTQTRQFVAPPRLAPLIEQFANAEAVRIGASTAAKYTRLMRHYAEWLGDDASLADVSIQRIGAYEQHLYKRKLSRATTLQYLAALRAFSAWCIRQGLRADNPLDVVVRPRLSSRLPRPLSVSDLDTLQRILADEPTDARERRIHERNVLAIRVLLYAGLRIGECAELRWSEIDMDAQYLVVRNGKGEKDRIVPLHPKLHNALTTIPAHRRRPHMAVVWSLQKGARTGQGVTRKSLAHIFDRWLPKRGLHITAHRLRHTCATLLVQAGVNLDIVADILGHADTRTTRIYAAFAVSQLHDGIRQMPDTW